jgi:hypothetical protein
MDRKGEAMSYVRMGTEGSDVYVYASYDAIHCEWCQLTSPCNSWQTESMSAMLEHLQKHRDVGHCVPQFAIDTITSDRDTYGDNVAELNRRWDRSLGLVPYMTLCDACYEPYVGKHHEELTIGIGSAICERCGKEASQRAGTCAGAVHTPRRTDIERIDKENPCQS